MANAPRLDHSIYVDPEVLEDGLSVNFRELLRIGDGLQDFRQVIRGLQSVHSRRLERAGRGVLKAEGLKYRHDVIAQP